MSETPVELGYRMPAEWEPHRGTWLGWPHNHEDWPGKFAPIPWVYAEIIRLLVQSEDVFLIVQGKRGETDARESLAKAGVPLDRVTFHQWKTDRVWLRDTGPSFVVHDEEGASPKLGIVDWRFNAWAKYENFRRDDKIPKRMSKVLGASRWKPVHEADDQPIRIVLEGGAIDVNGLGTILTTEECLLSDVQARNPNLDRKAMEDAFARYLGARHTIWLDRGIVGDDTHGHVDDIARFVAPKTVVAAVEDDPSDANYEILQENLRRLRSSKDQDKKPLRVVPLPMPRPVMFDGQRLPASYANFYIANQVVLVPTFNDPADRLALQTLAGLFPDRKVIGVHAVDLVWGLGTIHCLSREQPIGDHPGPADDSPEEPADEALAISP